MFLPYAALGWSTVCECGTSWSYSLFYMIIEIHHECKEGIEKSVPRITDWHHEACRVMTNGDHEGRIFLSHPPLNDEYFFSFLYVIIIMCQLVLSNDTFYQTVDTLMSFLNGIRQKARNSIQYAMSFQTWIGK